MLWHLLSINKYLKVLLHCCFYRVLKKLRIKALTIIEKRDNVFSMKTNNYALLQLRLILL